jgi:hypothetical protein
MNLKKYRKVPSYVKRMMLIIENLPDTDKEYDSMKELFFALNTMVNNKELIERIVGKDRSRRILEFFPWPLKSNEEKEDWMKKAIDMDEEETRKDRMDSEHRELYSILQQPWE